MDDVIIGTELACRNLSSGEAAELRSEVVGALRSSVPPKDNLTKSERAAIKSLKSDENIVILPADKGRCTVVLDLTDYEAKAKQLLDDTDTYQKLKKDSHKKVQKITFGGSEKIKK